jgi:hypothetical protein
MTPIRSIPKQADQPAIKPRKSHRRVVSAQFELVSARTVKLSAYTIKDLATRRGRRRISKHFACPWNGASTVPIAETAGRILRPPVEPATSPLSIVGSGSFQNSAVETEHAGHDELGSTELAQCFPEQFQRDLLVSTPGNDTLQHFAFVIESLP